MFERSYNQMMRKVFRWAPTYVTKTALKVLAGLPVAKSKAKIPKAPVGGNPNG